MSEYSNHSASTPILGSFNLKLRLSKLFRLTLAKRLVYGFSLLGFGVMAIMIASLAGLNRINLGVDALVQEAIPTKDQMAEARINLLQISTAAAEHYNSREAEQLEQIESGMSHAAEQFTALMDRLTADTTLIDQSGYLSDQLEQILAQVTEQIELIEWNMNTHRRSLERERRIREIREELQALRNQAKPIFNNTINDMGHPPAQALAYQLQGVMESTILMAINVSLANSLDVVENLQLQLRNNLDSLALMAFDIMDQIDADASFAEYHTNIAPLFSQLNQIATANDGLISQQRNLFIEIRDVLPAQIESAQNKLAVLADAFRDLSTAVDRSVNEISLEAVDNVALSRAIILLATAVIIMLCVLVSWLVIRSIRKPIRRLSHYMKQVGEGDFTVKVGHYQKDEIGEIFASTETLVEDFMSMVERIARLSDDINQVSRRTAEDTNAVRTTLNDQSQDLNSVATALTEMSASIREVAQITRSAADEMHQSEEKAHKIEQLVKESVASSNSLNEAMQRTTDVMNGLANEVTSIEHILEVIQGIAEQTNLLALNAAIEAARAGEQGRGFSVVADEVRTLASRTQQSTQEIRQKINSVTEGSQQVVGSIEHSLNNVADLSERVHRIHDIFDEYLQSVAKLSELNLQISASAEEQQATGEEMSQRTNAINDQGIAVSSRFESTTKRAKELNCIAQQLNETVSRIKL